MGSDMSYASTHAYHAGQDRLKHKEREKELEDALILMYKAWAMLFPNLKDGVVQDYMLVCTTAPLAAMKALGDRSEEVNT